VRGDAADEETPEPGAAMRGNDDKINIFICRIANLESRRAMSYARGISYLGSRSHGTHFLLRGICRLVDKLGRVKRRMLVSELIDVSIYDVHKVQLRVEIACKLKPVVKSRTRTFGEVGRQECYSSAHD
jgi:hypothetical protein